MDVYLLTGQSNMSGRGESPPTPGPADARIVCFGRDETWQVARHPLHFDKPARVGVGPGLSFARAMLDGEPPDADPNDVLAAAEIGLVPCAVGGSSLDEWRPGGKLYVTAAARARAAAVDGTLAGVLWHQGESDAQRRDDARTYGQRLLAMFTRLRRDLEAPALPIVVGTIGEFTLDKGFLFASQVNSALRALPEMLDLCACVEGADLDHKGDDLHFNAQAADALGRRYAEAMGAMKR